MSRSDRKHWGGALTSWMTLLGSAPVAAAQVALPELLPSVPESNVRIGQSVALDGDRLLLGTVALKVYVFERDGAGWVDVTQLSPSDGPAAAGFGSGVALSGDTAVVSAHLADSAGLDSGAAYVFQHDGAAWVEVAELAPAALAAGDHLKACAVRSDRLVLGSTDHNAASFGAGAVFAYELGPGGWAETQTLLASDAGPVSWFGCSVALDGDRLLVGAHRQDVDGEVDAGAAYVFERGPGGWVESARLVADDGADFDHFGVTVALEGELALVGAYGEDDGGNGAGAAYVFRLEGGVWSQVGKLMASDPQANAELSVVALGNGTAWVGAPHDHAHAGAGNAGAVYAFRDEGAGWAQVAKLHATVPQSSAELGHVVAAHGALAVAGAPGDHSGGSFSGAATVFELAEFVTPYCFCAGGAPCANQDPLAGCANSSGSGGHLAVFGSNSVAEDTLQAVGTGLLPNQPCLLFAGESALSGFAFGDGLRCAGVNVQRLGVTIPAADGAVDYGPGLAGAANWDAGDVRFLQAWYRDPAGSPCGSGFNLSNGVGVELAP